MTNHSPHNGIACHGKVADEKQEDSIVKSDTSKDRLHTFCKPPPTPSPTPRDKQKYKADFNQAV